MFIHSSPPDTPSSEEELVVAHMLLDGDQDMPHSGWQESVGQPASSSMIQSIGGDWVDMISFGAPPTFSENLRSSFGAPPKRKRDVGETAPKDESAWPHETKKQRKKRRKLERLVATAAGIRNQTDDSMEDGAIYLPYSAEDIATAPMVSSVPVAGPSTLGSRSFHPPPAYPPFYPAVEDLPMSSPWVSSMAMAGNPGSQPPRVTKTAPVAKAPPAAPAPASWVGVLPPKPPPALPIGMPPDADPKSKHGVFCTPATTRRAYVPNPARTLVMEQIPKPSRSMAFINGWAKDACGAFPVHIEIDNQYSKALVEFATADLARFAWSSPRLQRDALPVNAKVNKVDLIRVWWYRVDGINTGVGELEEGEIEGEVEKESSAPKTESKREKKARLAKEREMKLVHQQPQDNYSQPPPPPLWTPNNTTAISPRIVPTQPKAHGLPPKPATGPLPTKPTALQRPFNVPLPADRSTLSFSIIQSQHTRPSTGHVPSYPSSQQRAPLAPSSTSADDADAEVDMEVDSPSTPSFSDHVPVFVTPPAISVPSRSVLDPPREPRLHQSNSLTTSATKVSSSNRPSIAPPPSARVSSAHTPIVSIAAPPVNETSARGREKTLVPLNAPSVTFETVTTNIITSSAVSRSIPAKLAGHPPSEPRAMKNAPKQPRSFLARQKVLEERIAKSKAELGVVSKATATPPPASSPSPRSSPVPAVSSSSKSPSPESQPPERQVLEDNLRLLVLKSQKSRVKKPPPVVAEPPSSNGTVKNSSIAPNPSQPSPSPPPQLNPSPDQFSLDDLAESFITESIKEAKASPRLPAPISTTKHELAVKQKLLEKQIAESKLLMARLSKARTKEEKDAILVAMREQSRVLDDHTASRPLVAAKQSFSRIRATWPECEQPTILELSDSENSDLDDE